MTGFLVLIGWFVFIFLVITAVIAVAWVVGELLAAFLVWAWTKWSTRHDVIDSDSDNDNDNDNLDDND